MEKCKYAGQKMTVKSNYSVIDGEDFIVEDYWINLSGGISWKDSLGVPVTFAYKHRVDRGYIPIDDLAIYGKINGMGYLVHESELVDLITYKKEREEKFRKMMENECKHEFIIDEEGNHVCTKCGKKFTMNNYSYPEAEEFIRMVEEQRECVKIEQVMNDVPDHVIREYFQLLPLLNKLPQLYEKAKLDHEQFVDDANKE